MAVRPFALGSKSRRAVREARPPPQTGRLTRNRAQAPCAAALPNRAGLG